MSIENGRQAASCINQQPAITKGRTQSALFALATLMLAAFLSVALLTGCGKISQADADPDQAPAQTSQTAEKVDNPIDFASLQEQNPDIIGWVYVPGTKVNYPVVQHPSDNSYYLTHNVKGEQKATGAIFAELCNTATFTDPVTPLYGHNSTDGTMFSTLHRFEAQDFFDEHDTLYVYAPGHVLTYTISAAYVATDEHLMHRYDFFSTTKSMKRFVKDVEDPQSVNSHVREGLTLSASDRFVVLSTCNSTALGESNRYLVVGLLTNDQEAE